MFSSTVFCNSVICVTVSISLSLFLTLLVLFLYCKSYNLHHHISYFAKAPCQIVIIFYLLKFFHMNSAIIWKCKIDLSAISLCCYHMTSRHLSLNFMVSRDNEIHKILHLSFLITASCLCLCHFSFTVISYFRQISQ